ncbi:MAG: DUF547 domain-containing protein [Calothrix sp. C42_A2020_038]|nr:DUF547 domain-containing protein [Calothrix sp. C42_A2020_038]
MNNSIDFDLWDTLLKKYVNDQGRVNYLAWKRDEPEVLPNWLSSVATLQAKDNAGASEQLALWINLYNAFTVATILEKYPIESVLPKIFGIPNWLGFLRFFQRQIYVVGGKKYSLAQIENKILREKLQEPRIHFAIVCASIGCPLLRAGAYYPEKVDSQLEDDTRRFINNPEKVRYDAANNILYCSKIFKWYRQDFLKVAPSLPEYIRSYLNIDLLLTASTPVKYLYYDWNLNKQELI